MINITTKLAIMLCALGLAVEPVAAQTGTPAEPVSYVGGEICNPRLHDGGFGYMVGAENIQVMRANRTRPEMADSFGWTYNHAPNLTYWQGKFYLQYLSNPSDEHQPPGHTLITVSPDGRTWSKPRVAFPVYKAPEGVGFPEPYYGYIMHQRMGFYRAPDGRLLTVAFYGHSYDPFKQGGIGRVVREIYPDGSMGPIYFLRYSSHADWGEHNTTYPFYRRSPDSGFVAACDSLLADRLKTLQWIDEDRGLDGFYTLHDSINTVQATCTYHRADSVVVALWKKSWAALSTDEGRSWSTPVRVPSLIMAGGKNWGQRTADGRYAMAYNPIETQPYRYPLVATVSADGIVFDSMAVVHGEVPPRRFFGENKDFGPCYVRGITEGMEQPGDSCLWLTYSVNKEDIWVSRVPLPLRSVVAGPVNDTFDDIAAGAIVPQWNLYRPLWCDASVTAGGELRLADTDPYDYARAIRVFEPSEKVLIDFDIKVEADGEEPFEADITDRHGTRAAVLSLHKGQVVLNGVTVDHYTPGEWKHISLEADTHGTGTTTYGDRRVAAASAVKHVERLSLRTGPWRNLPDRNTPNQQQAPPLPGCDDPTDIQSYLIDNVSIRNASY